MITIIVINFKNSNKGLAMNLIRQRASSLPTCVSPSPSANINKQHIRKSEGRSKFFPTDDINEKKGLSSSLASTLSGSRATSAPNTPAGIRITPSSTGTRSTSNSPSSNMARLSKYREIPSNTESTPSSNADQFKILRNLVQASSPKLNRQVENKNKSPSIQDIALMSVEKITLQSSLEVIYEVAHKIDNEELLRVYGSGPHNWGDLPYFRGDYINFGYWDGLDITANITEFDRIKSSLALYQIIINSLNIENDHKVLEVGCGRGVGITEVLAKKPHRKIKALDMNEEQLRKTEKNVEKYNKKINEDSNKQELKVKYIQACADNTGLKDDSLDRIYSVEVAQHFDSILNFVLEMQRILKPGGLLVFTTYFLKNPKNLDELINSHLPHLQNNWDKVHLIETVLDDCSRVGFTNISYRSIGNNVFPGYDKFLEQNRSNEWSRCFNKAFIDEVIDYGIIMCEKK